MKGVMYLDCGDSYGHAGNDGGVFLYDAHQLTKAAVNHLQKKKKRKKNEIPFVSEQNMKPATELCCHTDLLASLSLHGSEEMVRLQQKSG